MLLIQLDVRDGHLPSFISLFFILYWRLLRLSCLLNYILELFI